MTIPSYDGHSLLVFTYTYTQAEIPKKYNKQNMMELYPQLDSTPAPEALPTGIS